MDSIGLDDAGMNDGLQRDAVDLHGHYLSAAWRPPIRLHRAGREVRSTPAYRCRADYAVDVPRLLVQRTHSGQGTVLVSGRRHRVGPGQALVVAIPGTAVWAYEGDGTPWDFVFASIACPALPDLGSFPVIDLAGMPALDRVFAMLVERRLGGDDGPQPALAYQLLLGVVGLALGADREQPEDRLAARIARAEGRCRISQLARQLGGSHAALTRRFTRRFGEPPRAWAERLRLRSACARLATGVRPGVAADAAGYDDPAHFGRVFRRRLGLTPGAWATLADALRPWP